MFLYYLLATASVFLYLQAFFPVHHSQLTDPPKNETNSLPPKFDKAVIVVIDALRLDFVTPTLMPFTAAVLNRNGCFISLKVETPTVTLPRIKALISGNVPQFVDVVLNLAYTEALQDSLVHRAYARKRDVVFYGDDTWLKLFPNYFKRSEGTTSFYVNDFKEVDDNVTRNVKLELGRSDWHIMILHYLGLDHIGHVLGPKSHLVPAKLKEMDGIIEQIYTSFDQQSRTMVVITGDHGMKDSGGHGGSTHSETNVPFVILGTPCRNHSAFQTDVPANMAILLGLDIPQTSIGQIRSSFLADLSLTEYLEALRYNTLLLKTKSDLCDDYDNALYFHDLYVLNKSAIYGQRAAELYETCAKMISETLVKSSVTQNVQTIVISIVAIIYILLKCLQQLGNNRTDYLEATIVLALLIIQYFHMHNLSLVLAVLIGILATKAALNLNPVLNFNVKNFVGVMSFVHPLIFGSSSYVEEEHQFWYFVSATFLLINFVHCCKTVTSTDTVWILMLLGIRFLRTMNQVGDQWASAPDLSDWLLTPGNYFYLQAFHVTGLILTLPCFVSRRYKIIDGVTNAIIFIAIYIFRTIANDNVTLGSVLWLVIFIKSVFYVISGASLVNVWLLIITLLMKPYNVILIPSCFTASRFIQHKIKDSTVLILTHIWLSNLMYFMHGHCNSLASIDVGSAYVGLSSYQPVIVGLQLISHTYALTGLSHFLLLSNPKIDKSHAFLIWLCYKLYVILVVFVITFIQRHHLFIWSVFAPKVFIESGHFAFLVIEFCLFYAAAVVSKFWNNITLK